MMCNVLMGMLNPTHSLTPCPLENPVIWSCKQEAQLMLTNPHDAYREVNQGRQT